ncbi:MAG: methyltransferase family protein [Lacibacter sp.]|jgi:protein-S-isoprenylcysteine O-methyltransferase Ste14
MGALVIYWVIFYTLHSLLAAGAVKRQVQQKFHLLREPRYRLCYNAIAVVTFLLLLWLHIQTPSRNLWQPGVAGQAAGAILLMGGVVVLLAAFRNYRLQPFLGLEVDANQQLQTTGLNRYMRHPIYTAVLTAFAGLCLLQPLSTHVVAFFITVVYVWIGSSLEERKLLLQYGTAYADYRRRVKRFIPFIWMLLLILHMNQYPL